MIRLFVVNTIRRVPFQVCSDYCKDYDYFGTENGNEVIYVVRA